MMKDLQEMVSERETKSPNLINLINIKLLYGLTIGSCNNNLKKVTKLSEVDALVLQLVCLIGAHGPEERIRHSDDH